MAETLRLALFSPYTRRTAPFSPSAYAAQLLLPELTRRFDVTLFCDPSAEGVAEEIPPSVHFLNAYQEHRRRPFDIVLYQLEDSRHTAFCQQHCGVLPGVVWSHQILRREEPPTALHSSPWRETIEAFNSGRTSGFAKRCAVEKDNLGSYALREAGFSVASYFSLPQSHSEYRRLRGTFPEISLGAHRRRSAYVPLPVAKTPRSPGLDESTLQAAFTGSPQVENRPHKVIAALVEAAVPCIWVIDDHEREAAERRLAAYPGAKVTLRTPRTPEVWEATVQECAIALHPFFSVFGSLEPFLGMSLSAGLFTVVSSFGSGDYLPESLVFKVEPGEHEATVLAETLRRISCDRRELAPLSDRVRAWAEEVYGLGNVAADLSAELRLNAAAAHDLLPRWRAFEEAATADLLKGLRALYPADLRLSGPYEMWPDPYEMWVERGRALLPWGTR